MFEGMKLTKLKPAKPSKKRKRDIVMRQQQRRLMDLLAGWSVYARQSLEEYNPSTDSHNRYINVQKKDYRQEIEAVDELYQTVGRVDLLTDDALVVIMRRIEAIVTRKSR